MKRPSGPSLPFPSAPTAAGAGAAVPAVALKAAWTLLPASRRNADARAALVRWFAYAVIGAVDATLMGLLFVALSMNAVVALSRGPEGSRRLAEQAFENYLAVLMVSLLALLLLALGDPRAAQNLIEGRNIVVLVDASASMQASRSINAQSRQVWRRESRWRQRRR